MVQTLATPAHPPTAAFSGDTTAVLDLALQAEREPRRWARAFTALLAHPALVALPDAGGTPVSAGTLAAQFALRFPLVSGDSEWLRERSMVVVARRLAPLLARGAAVALDLSTLARGEACAVTRREQMHDVAAGLADALPQVLRRYGIAPQRLLLSAEADHPGLGDLLRLHGTAALGHPPLVLRLPDRLMQSLQDDRAGDRHREALGRWQGLTALAQREPGIHLVLQRTTRPSCSLASSERADAVLPASLFETQADSAWLALQLRLDRLVAADMATALTELRELLRSALRFADNLVDQLDWPSPELAQDALVNRRLALHVTGIGGVADRWSLDPTDARSVGLLLRWLGLVRRLLVRESNALARERGPFPGLELRQLTRSLARSLGEERARRVLRRAGLRHRHLLVLSPWDVFPEHAPRWPTASYLQLLPAIRHADTIAMHGDGQARALPASTFRRLLHQTWVIAHNRP